MKIPVLKLRFEVIWLIGVVAGISLTFSWHWLWLIVLAVLCRRHWAVFTVAVLLGVAANRVQHIPTELERVLPDRLVYLQGQFEITDQRLTLNPKLANSTFVTARLLQFGYGGKTYRTNETIFVRLPEKLQAFPGEVYRGAGRLDDPDGDFSQFLASRGAERAFYPESLTQTGINQSVWYYLSLVREGLLDRAISGIDNAQIAQGVAMMFFGAGKLPGEFSQLFLNSGMFHIFSISGMHVVFFAAVMLFFLRLLPFRLRYYLLLILVLWYVAMSGGNPPAVRAFVLIAVFCVLRANLLYMPVFHVLCLTAGAMLLYNPVWRFDAGFLYSFVITGALILSIELYQKLERSYLLRYDLIADRQLKFHKLAVAKRYSWIWLSLWVCVSAYLAGLGISLYCQSLFAPGSVFANFLGALVLPWLFPVMVAKLLLADVPWADLGLAKLLEGGFYGLFAIADTSARAWSFWRAVRPELWQLFLYYFAFAAVLLFPRKRVILCGALTMAALIFVWSYAAYTRGPVIYVLYGGSPLTPAVLIVEPRENYACLVNAPGGAVNRQIRNLVAGNGVGAVDELVFWAPRRDYSRGQESLAASFPVRQTVLPPPDRYSRRFFEGFSPALDFAAQKNCKIFQENDTFRLEYFNPRSTFNRSILIRQQNTGLMIKIAGNEWLLPHANRLEILQYGAEN